MFDDGEDIQYIRNYGAQSIANVTGVALDAIRDAEKVAEMVQTLTNYATRPPRPDAPLNELCTELLQLICNAHAVLEAAEYYGEEPDQKAMAVGLRQFAKTFLKQAANSFSNLMARSIEEQGQSLSRSVARPKGEVLH